MSQEVPVFEAYIDGSTGKQIGELMPTLGRTDLAEWRKKTDLDATLYRTIERDGQHVRLFFTCVRGGSIFPIPTGSRRRRERHSRVGFGYRRPACRP
jgi:hypothetical protein